jgi:type I restriction enzyme M protein
MEASSPPSSEAAGIRRLLEVLAATPDADSVVDAADMDLGRPRIAAYSAIVGAVAFSGSVGSHDVADEVRALARSRRVDLVALACALLSLKEGGRMALIVPASVLDGDTMAHRAMRGRLVEDNTLQAVIGLSAGVFRPRLRAAILLAIKGGSSERVGFHRIHSVREIAQFVARWPGPPGVATVSRIVPREAIAAPHYTLAPERYLHERTDDDPRRQPHEILHEIAALEAEILQGIRDLVGMLR